MKMEFSGLWLCDKEIWRHQIIRIRMLSGAKLALYDAIRVKRTGDSQDHAFGGVEISRDRNGNVTDIVVKEGHAGEKLEFPQKMSEEESSGEEIWEIGQ